MFVMSSGTEHFLLGFQFKFWVFCLKVIWFNLLMVWRSVIKKFPHVDQLSSVYSLNNCALDYFKDTKHRPSHRVPHMVIHINATVTRKHICSRPAHTRAQAGAYGSLAYIPQGWKVLSTCIQLIPQSHSHERILHRHPHANTHTSTHFSLNWSRTLKPPSDPVPFCTTLQQMDPYW